MLVARTFRLVEVGRKPNLIVMEHVAAAPEAPLEVAVEPLKPSDLLFVIIVGHGLSTDQRS